MLRVGDVYINSAKVKFKISDIREVRSDFLIMGDLIIPHRNGKYVTPISLFEDEFRSLDFKFLLNEGKEWD